MNPSKIYLNQKLAVCGVVIANLILGFSSLYWHALELIPATTLVGYRILLSLITLIVVILITDRLFVFIEGLNYHNFLIHLLAAVMVALNWFAFIWASISGYVVESGIGYLLAPFVTIAVGAILLAEKINTLDYVALLIIFVMVLIIIRGSDELKHWIYLLIGLSWGIYICLKKVTTFDSLNGLFCETIILSCILLILVASSISKLQLPQNLPSEILYILLFSGIVSIVPLFLFSYSATKLSLSIIGFFQFVLPITQLFVAIFFYKQQISVNTLSCFLIILLILMMVLIKPFLYKIVSNGENL